MVRIMVVMNIIIVIRIITVVPHITILVVFVILEMMMMMMMTVPHHHHCCCCLVCGVCTTNVFVILRLGRRRRCCCCCGSRMGRVIGIIRETITTTTPDHHHHQSVNETKWMNDGCVMQWLLPTTTPTTPMTTLFFTPNTLNIRYIYEMSNDVDEYHGWIKVPVYRYSNSSGGNNNIEEVYLCHSNNIPLPAWHFQHATRWCVRFL